MTLKARITDDMKAALRAKDAARLSAIRLLVAAIKQREIDERKEMADADVLVIIDKMVKQRKDSIAQFDAGNRKVETTLYLDGKTVRMDSSETYASPEAASKAFERLKKLLAGEGYKPG